MKRWVVVGLAVLAGGGMTGGWTNHAWGIVPGQTGELPQTGPWSGTNWSWSTAGVYRWNDAYNGSWYSGSAVAIGSEWLLTAGHIGAGPDAYMVANDVVYRPVETFMPPSDPGQSGVPDLKLIRLDKPLPVHATLYTGELSRNQPVTLIGFGESGTVKDGWATWDPSTKGFGRWGTNVIDTPAYRMRYENYSSQTFSMMLTSINTEYEALAANGDSGGGVFVKVGDQWQLAGILGYANGSGTWAMSVPYYADWIQSVTGLIPEPTMLWALPMGILMMGRRNRNLHPGVDS